MGFIYVLIISMGLNINSMKKIIDSTDYLDITLPENEKLRSDPRINNASNLGLCLLIKDDNGLLPEWIAYHYHALGLRHLVVAIDPTSKTSPSPILRRFANILSDLNIEKWGDNNFMPDFFLEKNYSRVPNFVGSEYSYWMVPGSQFHNETIADKLLVSINNHRFRQVQFVGECLRYLSQNGTDRWMAHIDTDEFLVVNPRLKDDTRYQQLARREKSPWETLEASSVLHFLDRWLVNYPLKVRACIQVPRLLFGDSERNKIHRKAVVPIKREHIPKGFENITKFETLRWKWHARYNASQNGLPKVIMDLSKLKSGDRILEPRRRASSVHRISDQLCPPLQANSRRAWMNNPLAIHHYLGSAERFLEKGDPRRNRQLHLERSEAASQLVDEYPWLDGWLSKFVEKHGREKVSQLLPEHLANSSMR